MRDVFPGYYKPTKDELTELWANALVVLDTNALFNLFRYTNDTRSAFLNVLATKRERLWLPHQVGLEFQRGRLGIIHDQEQAFTDLITKSKTALATVTKDVGTLRNHPTLNLDELKTTVTRAIKTIEDKIETTRAIYQTEVLAAARHDETTDTITELYTSRVGAPFSEARLAEIFANGAARYEAKRPPGYKDGNKPEPERYGDLILWFQILDKAASDSTAMIFVGDDQKEDWWRDFKGRKIGPRIELVDEFYEHSGKRIYFLTPHALMELAKELDDETISADTVQEIAAVSQAQAQLNEYTVKKNRRQIHAYDEEFVATSTFELELEVERLVGQRDKHERLLRDALGEMNNLNIRGIDDPAKRAVIDGSVIRHRSAVANLSRELKSAESALFHHQIPWQNRPRRGDVSSPETIEIARMLLMRAGISPPQVFDAWSDVSDVEMADIVLRAERGVAPQSITHALRPLSHDFRSPLQRARWAQPTGDRGVDELLGVEID